MCHAILSRKGASGKNQKNVLLDNMVWVNGGVSAYITVSFVSPSYLISVTLNRNKIT